MRLRKIFLLTNIVVIGFILWVGFTIYRTWASSRAGVHRPSVTGARHAAGNHSRPKTATNMSTFKPVIKADIFKTHKSPVGPPAPKKSPAAVKETDLDLELKGTMIDDTGERFAVILDGKTRGQQAYAEGDFVNGVHIEKILADRVILDRKGTEEALVMSYKSGPAPVRRPPRKIRPRRRIVRAPPGRKNIHVKRRLPVRWLPPEKEGTSGP